MTCARLSAATLAALSPRVTHFGYNRADQATGIVHFGIGAFHRAHQAWYTDRAMDAGDRGWAIQGVSLRSADVAEQMNPQDGLYTVSEGSGAGIETRLVGSVRGVVEGRTQRESVIEALASPATSIVSFTITEKGYCRSADGSLDYDLAGDGSVFAFLAAAMRRRQEGGRPGLTLLSCDNLADNGRQLERLMGEYLDRHDPALGRWFRAECACPCAMVDRIVPATTDVDRDRLAERIGVRDEAAVMTEAFSQWVIEDRFAGPRPRWEQVGVEIVADVRAYETAKLRMLNGAHSMLAYVGLARGYGYVHEAIADPELRSLALSLMVDEAAPTFAPAPGQDLHRYAEALIDRFANPGLNHHLIQIAMDGSQKIPQRWLETMAANQSARRESPAIMAGIEAWVRHLQGFNGPVDDPWAAELAHAAAATDPVRALFGAGRCMASAWEPVG